MNDNIKWTINLLEIVNNKSVEEVLEWCGNITEKSEDYKNDLIYFLSPNNTNIDKIVINLENGKIDRIGVFGNEFTLPFNFIREMTEEYKTTLNTYDPIDDEQFIFYPILIRKNLIAIDSWIPKEQQTQIHENIQFKEINFYFSKNKVPYHFRDGWHLIDPEKKKN